MRNGQAIPAVASAAAWRAWAAAWWAALCYWWPDNAEGYRIAARQAVKAVQLDNNEPWARMTHGICLSSARHHESALVELRAALEDIGWSLLNAKEFILRK